MTSTQAGLRAVENAIAWAIGDHLDPDAKRLLNDAYAKAKEASAAQDKAHSRAKRQKATA